MTKRVHYQTREIDVEFVFYSTEGLRRPKSFISFGKETCLTVEKCEARHRVLSMAKEFYYHDKWLESLIFRNGIETKRTGGKEYQFHD